MFDISYKIYPQSIPQSTILTWPWIQNISTEKLKEAIYWTATEIMLHQGYIQITRTAEIISASGLNNNYSYDTYITYLPITRNGTSVHLTRSDGEKMLTFRDNGNDDSLHADFYGKDYPDEQIALLLTRHFLQGRRHELSEEQVQGLQSYMIELQTFLDEHKEQIKK